MAVLLSDFRLAGYCIRVKGRLKVQGARFKAKNQEHFFAQRRRDAEKIKKAFVLAEGAKAQGRSRVLFAQVGMQNGVLTGIHLFSSASLRALREIALFRFSGAGTGPRWCVLGRWGICDSGGIEGGDDCR
jgi:hypothetical protein